MNPTENTGINTGIIVVYDGQCPVCSHYVKHLRLTRAGKTLRLLDAREASAEVLALQAAGHDLNREMMVGVGGQWYAGADAMHMLTLLSSPLGMVNRSLYLLFRSPTAGRLAYPVFRNLRLILLRLLGRKPIAAPDVS